MVSCRLSIFFDHHFAIHIGDRVKHLDHLPQPTGDGEQVQIRARQELQFLLSLLRAAGEARMDQRRDSARQLKSFMRGDFSEAATSDGVRRTSLWIFRGQHRPSASEPRMPAAVSLAVT
jgi:hypothetical protein